MKLYGLGKSRSFRALWALEEAEIAYEYIPVKLGSRESNGTASDAYQTLNYQGKVPTLEDGGLVVTESGAILNYIAARSVYKELMPVEDIQRRAKYDEMCCFVLTELEQGLWTNGKHRFALPEQQRIPEILPTATWEFNKAVNALLALFSGHEYVMGGAFSMADVLLAHTLDWAESFGFKVPDDLLKYRDNMFKRPACIRALKELDEKQNND